MSNNYEDKIEKYKIKSENAFCTKNYNKLDLYNKKISLYHSLIQLGGGDPQNTPTTKKSKLSVENINKHVKQLATINTTLIKIAKKLKDMQPNSSNEYQNNITEIIDSLNKIIDPKQLK